MILKDIPENEETECENTENIISKKEEIITGDLEDGNIIGSMDVKALALTLI